MKLARVKKEQGGFGSSQGSINSMRSSSSFKKPILSIDRSQTPVPTSIFDEAPKISSEYIKNVRKKAVTIANHYLELPN